MTVKEKAIRTIDMLPSNVSLEEIVDNLLFLNKIERGAAQLDRGEGLTSKEAEKILFNG